MSAEGGRGIRGQEQGRCFSKKTGAKISDVRGKESKAGLDDLRRKRGEEIQEMDRGDPSVP